MKRTGVPKHLADLIAAHGGKVARPNKFGSVRTGHYASKREAKYATELGMRKKAANGDVLDWIEQVPVRLSCGRYVVDFLVFMRDGSWSLVEVKGFETAAWKMKMRALAEERPELFKMLEVVR